MGRYHTGPAHSLVRTSKFRHAKRVWRCQVPPDPDDEQEVAGLLLRNLSSNHYDGETILSTIYIYTYVLYGNLT